MIGIQVNHVFLTVLTNIRNNNFIATFALQARYLILFHILHTFSITKCTNTVALFSTSMYYKGKLIDATERSKQVRQLAA